MIAGLSGRFLVFRSAAQLRVRKMPSDGNTENRIPITTYCAKWERAELRMIGQSIIRFHFDWNVGRSNT